MAHGLKTGFGCWRQSHSARLRRQDWRLAAVLLAALVFAVLPADRIRLGASQLQGLVGSYSYWLPAPLGQVSGLTVEEVYLPGRVRVNWAAMGASYAPEGFHYLLQRINPGDGTVMHYQNLWEPYWEEDVDLSATTEFEYWVCLVPNSGGGSPGDPPPSGADPADIGYYSVAGPYAQLRFHVENAEVSANQVVDSRYDLRYGNPTYLDFPFGSRIYRGGLFAGFANDPSRVARSFLKFPIPAGVQDGVYFTGSVNAYATAMLTGQSVEVGAQKVTDATWDPATLKWTAAPTLDPSQAPRRFTFSQADAWGHWSLGADILNAQGATDPLSVALASTNENASGQWVYLAKKEYVADLAPRVLIAGHYPGETPATANLTVQSVTSSSVTLSWSTPVVYGQSVLQMRPLGGSWQDVFSDSNGRTLSGGEVIPASFNVPVNNLTANTAYEFRVKADTQTYGEYYSHRVTATTAP